jgi:hypothetical protein
MALDIQLVQSSKKKHKKDRKRNDRDSGTGDLAVTEEEEKRKRRKERKEKKEGAIDGALSFSFALQRADPGAIVCAYSCRSGKWQRRE